MQVLGQDFTEMMSPVACLASYHAILSLAAKLDLEMHHLDIETAFLNGSLDEEIYMKAPNGFDGGSSVCVAKGSGKVRSRGKEVSRGKVRRLHTVFRVLTQSEDLISSLHSIYSSTSV